MGKWSNEVTITVTAPGKPPVKQPVETQQVAPSKKPSLGAIVALGVIAALFAAMQKKR